MKKILSFLLIISLFLGSVLCVGAIEMVSINVNSFQSAPGETVQVPIALDKNSGFISMSLWVTYDETAMTLISFEDTQLIQGAKHSGNLSSPCKLTWENDTLTSNITSTGTIVYLTFLVSEDAKEQDYSIIVRIPTDGILDANGNSVSANSAMGTITVSKQHECSFGDWEYYSKTKHVRYCDGDDCDEKEYKNHNWNDGEIIKEPTHDEEGEIEYTCADCGATKTTEIDPEGHDWGDWTKLSDTQHKRTCSCGAAETEAHNWDSGVVTKQPTSTEAGIRTYTCEDCGATKTESIDPDTIVVIGVSLSQTSATLKVGNTLTLIANVAPSNATNKNVTWSSTNPSVASVLDGVVTANRAGTATITVKTADGGFEATCVVTVEAEPQPGDKTIVGYKWYSGVLRHKVMYSDGTYDMEDCAPADCICGRQYNYVPVTGITLSETNVVLKVGNTKLVAVNVQPEDATDRSIVWSISDPSVIEIHESVNKKYINIIALSGGTATIIGTTNDGQFVATCVVTVKDGSIDYVPGDINGDGVLDNTDVSRFMQYNAGWDVEVNMVALDVNGDGSINNKDVTRLMQYNAGWDVEIH